MNDLLLSVRDLKTYFRTPEGPARAVDGVSFDIHRGETLALVGESGCGKSVTAFSIIRLLAQPPGYIAGGSILYKGRDILRIPEFEMRGLRGREISMIFQEPMTSLNPVFTVGYQIGEVLRRHEGMGAAEAERRSVELLGKVGIPDPEGRAREYPHQLSGGMRQRAMIAIALACRPGLLIADEPTTALDVTIQAQILELMRVLQQEMGTAVLLITHNMGVVAENADRIGVMYAGRIVEMADRQTLFNHPAHPYTARLLQSLPSATRRDRALETIEGRVPRSTAYPPFCRFADRCHKVMDACRTVDPPLYSVEAGHEAACILYDEKRMQRKASSLEVLTQPPLRAVTAPSAGAPLVEVRGMKVHFPIRRGFLQRTSGFIKAVDGVDLSIPRGATIGLVGESGCGKTTLGKALLQLIPVTSGSVMVEGTDLTRLSAAELQPYRRKLQIVFQDPYASLDPRMMVGEIIAEGMKTHRIGRTRAERFERGAELLARVGLDPAMMHRYPHEFSGGQRQRVGIARSLAVNPEFIVCDEATSALDVSVQAQIVNLLEKLQSELGLAYLLITHDLSVVEYLADQVAVMYQGKIVERGPSAQIFDDPQHEYTKTLLSAIPQIAKTGT